jgi:3-oxoacyl-[acyl-carrier protein] reductase
MSDTAVHTMELCVTHTHMEAFAAFCGDRSALHMDAGYGRRSRFGGNVVHGMLPLMALPALVDQAMGGAPVRVVAAKARFLRPVKPGDGLRITATVEPTTAGTRIPFEVISTQDSTVATRGHLEVEPCSPAALVGPKDAAPMTGSLAEADHRFEDLATGTTTALPFHWGPAQYHAMVHLFRALRGDHAASGPDVVPPAFDAQAYGLLALLSTQVGMVMPGRTATFQEFELRIHGGPVRGAAHGELSSTLTFLSAAAQTLTQEVVVTLGGSTVATGRVVVQVARSPFVPPSMAELAASALDIGLKDKVVLITGGARGLGATTAKLFALHGARVVVNYRASKAQAEAVVADITAHGGQAMALQADVADTGAVHDMVRRIAERWAPVYVLVNNAAANFHPIAFERTAWHHMQEDLDVVLKGAFNAVQAVLPGFVEQGGGRIINVSTVAVETPPKQQAKYVVAKSALMGLTRALAVELADRHVLVNMVVPGFVETDLTSGYNRVAIGQMRASTPLKRLAEPRDVAQAIVHLASAQSRFTTGQKIMVTGGAPPFL